MAGINTFVCKKKLLEVAKQAENNKYLLSISRFTWRVLLSMPYLLMYSMNNKYFNLFVSQLRTNEFGKLDTWLRLAMD